MGIDLKGIMGDAAYRNVRTRATLLQLAYMAAAANGQTGRTLSDKDLAYHLQIVGFGASQDPRVLKANLLAFIDSLEKEQIHKLWCIYLKKGWVVLICKKNKRNLW